MSPPSGRTLRALLREARDYRLLLLGGLVSLTGDWLLGIGLAYYVYVLTGSTLASGLTVLSGLLPQLLLGSVAGVFADRWDRRRTMWVVDLLLAASLLPLLAVHSADDVWVVYVVSFGESCLAQFFSPAEAAVVPQLVPAEDLLTANAVNGQVRNVARLVGGGLGGVATAAGGLPLLVALDGASYLLSALLIWRMRVRPEPRPVGDVEAEAVRAFTRMTREWRDGARVALHSSVLRPLFAFVALVHVGEGIMATLFAPFVRSVLHGSGAEFGQVVAAQAVGGVTAGLLVARVARGHSTRSLMGVGAVVFGALDLALFLYPLLYVGVAPAIGLMVVIGLPGALVSAGVTTVLQVATPDTHRGRVLGARGALAGAGMLLGIGIAGTLGDRVGIVPVIAVQGAGYVLGGLWLLARMPREPVAPATPVVLATA